MNKLTFVLAGGLLLIAAVVAVAEVRDALHASSPPSLATVTTEPELAVANSDDALAAATWVETGRYYQDTRKPRLPQPRVPTRRR
jgi:hypothetical protein